MDDEAPYKMAARNRALMPGLVHAITNKWFGSSLTTDYTEFFPYNHLFSSTMRNP
jgi:hypothetical protein